MIAIKIQSDGKDVLDSFIKKNVTIQEAAVVLLRLRQIEQKIVDMDFDSKIEITKDEEDGDEKD